MKALNLDQRQETTPVQATDQLVISRFPILLWISLVYVASIILQSIEELLIFNSLIFTFIFGVHAFLHWNAYRLTVTKSWLYFFIQGFLIYTSALLVPGGSPAILIGFLPVLIGQSIGLYYHKKNILFVVLCCFSFFFAAQFYLGQLYDLVLLVPIFLFMVILTGAYALLYFQQVHARIRTQLYVKDLETAHRKVEELTLMTERQRMARDLHDTLAQGLAGLIMQLEAADAFISQGNIPRSQEIIQRSMSQARKTLADARRAIDNLRIKSVEGMSFQEALTYEIRRFIQATGIEVVDHVQISSHLSRTLIEHSMQIISECFTNIAKHAQANKLWVSIIEQNDRVQIKIRDNGIGFNTERIGKEPGHYGILGIQERARLIEGEVRINSYPEGTQIFLEFPVHKGA
ncbi:sensor histidine kinase [Paenibacillus sp. A14]|uniref:sensor histidine kinase n=1 Tax=Paenibacillus sp. A14 TaxID=3119820 RepID=UPI002FE09F3B